MKTTPNNKETLLISVNRGYEADLIKGSLKSANIPFYTKEHSGPAGFPRFDDKYENADIDFFVPEEMLTKAKMALPPIDSTKDIKETVSDETITENETAATDGNDNKGNKQTTDDSKKNEKSSKKSTVATVLFIILAIAVIFGIDAVMNIVRKAMGWE